jgi:hypothetical protein
VQVTIGTSLILTFLAVLISIGGLLLFRQKILIADLKDQHEVTDPYSQFVGMLFAVLLGFMVADAMQRFSYARQTVQQESSAIGNVFRTCDGLPTANRDKIRKLCADYCRVVIDDEWPKLKEKKTSRKAWDVYRELWKECVQYEPVTPKQVNCHASLMSDMSEVGDERRIRADAIHNGMPAVLWAVLIVGGVATILFTYFFTPSNLKVQIVMVSIVSLVICLNIFLLASYDDPFSGDVMVNPTMFETQLKLCEIELNPEKNSEQTLEELPDR